MKNIFTILFFLFSVILFGQSPQSFNYQGAARNNEGEVLANRDVGLQISILEGIITGGSVYTETHFITTTEFGLFSLAIGTGEVQFGEFSSIAWGSGAKFLNVAMDVTGGVDFIDMGTS